VKDYSNCLKYHFVPNTCMYHNESIFSIAKRAYKREGIRYVIRAGTKSVLYSPEGYFWLLYYKIFKSSETFRFQGNSYNYYYSQFGTTWKNERSIEIPIILSLLRNSGNKNILEVGNVLSYRFPVNHDVLDKYDKKKNVINEDVIDFNPAKRYDLIVSISTLEHVGWDEIPRDPTKILAAIENLVNILAPNGIIVVTLPLGQNPEMDQLLREGDLKFDKEHYFKRMSSDKWEEVRREALGDVRYDHSVPTANAILVGIINKKKPY
jgi:hypothetical protein